MPTLTIYVTEETYARLAKAAKDAGRDETAVEEFAESAVEEAALQATKHIPTESLRRRRNDT